MKRSILSRFALLNILAFAAAICLSLVVSNINSQEGIAYGYLGVATAASEEAQLLLEGMTYEDVVTGDSATYERLRTALRDVCSVFEAKYLYIYEVDLASATRTYLFCVAQEEDEDELVRKERFLGAQSSVPLSKQELTAIEGKADATGDTINNEFGFNLCWYFPFDLAGSTKPIIVGVDYDAYKEEQAICEHMLSFMVPMMVAITSIVVFELILLKRTVSNPLRMLADRMRNFTQDGAQSQEHVAIDHHTLEIANIETSFNQMCDDIDTYVGRIAQMCEERVSTLTELEVARRIQHGLVPPTTHCAHEGFDAYAFERTARAVGGDFYDLTVLDDGKLLLVIADVSGKGVSAALFMAMFRTLIHDKLQTYLDPARALNEANDIVTDNNPENMFVTIIAGIFDPQTLTLTFANAGHTPPLVVGGTYLSPDPGIALGLFEDAGIVNETLSLKPGEGVLFYTDGATEAVNTHDQFFGEDRLMQAAHTTRGAQDVVDHVVEQVDAFVGEREQFDDLTLLALFATETRRTGWQATLAPELASFVALREQILELCGTGPRAKEAILACDEAFSNVVRYAGATAVEVELSFENDELVMRMADDGVPFDPLAHEAQDLAFEDLDMGGMGIMLMRETSDDLGYEYADGKNVLTMRFGF